MAITVRWNDANNTAIYIDVDGQWTWEEFHGAVQQIHRLMDTVNHRVDAIFDLSDSEGLPEGALSQARKLTANSHRNAGATILVQAGLVIQTTFSMFRHVYGKLNLYMDIHFVSSMDAANKLLQRWQLERERAS